jgi:hypothetical protein
VLKKVKRWKREAEEERERRHQAQLRQNADMRRTLGGDAAGGAMCSALVDGSARGTAEQESAAALLNMMGTRRAAKRAASAAGGAGGAQAPPFKRAATDAAFSALAVGAAQITAPLSGHVGPHVLRREADLRRTVAYPAEFLIS